MGMDGGEKKESGDTTATQGRVCVSACQYLHRGFYRIFKSGSYTYVGVTGLPDLTP